MKKIKTVVIVLLSLLILRVTFIFTDVSDISERHGIVDSILYLGKPKIQLLIVVHVLYVVICFISEMWHSSNTHAMRRWEEKTPLHVRYPSKK
jgi:isoprenylcysteine carboxyl methyltransferase (ICMT) family protein YpbQ